MDLTGGMQVRVPETRQKYHRPRHKKILDGYENFSIYVVVKSLRATAKLGSLDVWRRMMTLEAIGVVSRISQNNNNTPVLSTPFVPYLQESHEQLLSRIEQLQ